MSRYAVDQSDRELEQYAAELAQIDGEVWTLLGLGLLGEDAESAAIKRWARRWVAQAVASGMATAVDWPADRDQLVALRRDRSGDQPDATRKQARRAIGRVGRAAAELLEALRTLPLAASLELDNAEGLYLPWMLARLRADGTAQPYDEIPGYMVDGLAFGPLGETLDELARIADRVGEIEDGGGPRPSRKARQVGALACVYGAVVSRVLERSKGNLVELDDGTDLDLDRALDRDAARGRFIRHLAPHLGLTGDLTDSAILRHLGD